MQQESMKSGASTSLSDTSPSFTSYSSENIADIAARVVHELNLSHDDPYDDEFYSSSLHQDDAVESDNAENITNDDDDNDDDDDDDSEFEFAVLGGGEEYTSPISADEIFYNGQIKPIYPLFNTDLVYGVNQKTPLSNKTATLRLPLRKLMKEERERGNDSVSSSNSSSSSSNENDELQGVPHGTYCVWAPKKKSKEEETVMKKKSKSTGASSNNNGSSSSKRWRFKDLLYRSNSDGKDTFVFLTPTPHNHHGGGGEEKVVVKRREKMTAVNKRKSYLPYRQDLVGFFANVNGVSRTIRPF